MSTTTKKTEQKKPKGPIANGTKVTWRTGNSDEKTGRILCLSPAGKNTWDALLAAGLTMPKATWKGGMMRSQARGTDAYLILVEREGARGPLKPEIYTPLASLVEKQNPRAKRA